MTSCTNDTNTLTEAKVEIDQSTPLSEFDRQIVIFFDGTENQFYQEGLEYNTNVGKLWHHLDPTKRDDLLKFYIEGVGARNKKIGSATGWGIDHRVIKAYSYLLENYRKGDEIHIVGFSRGAYSARILASLLYSAGVPDIPTKMKIKFDSDYDTSDAIYSSFKGDKSPDKRSEDIEKLFDRFDSTSEISTVDVKTLILWDTVETLGFTDTWEAFWYRFGFYQNINVGERNKRYGDQLCNVELALHALSIDDNRPDAFTQKLLTLPHLYENCRSEDQSPINISRYNDVLEVWFSGAHSDVGGGYHDSTGLEGLLSNISLQWVYDELQVKRNKLLRKKPTLSTDNKTPTHDGHSLGKSIYREGSRNIPGTTQDSGELIGYKHAIHCSVIERLSSVKLQKHEYTWSPEIVSDRCFTERDGYLDYKGSGSPQAACTDNNLVRDYESCRFVVY